MGITSATGQPFILIFSGPRGEEFGYADGWQEDGSSHYTGEGQVGDMAWERGICCQNVYKGSRLERDALD